MEETNNREIELRLENEAKVLPRRGWRDLDEYDRVMYRTLALIEKAELAYREKMMNANSNRVI